MTALPDLRHIRHRPVIGNIQSLRFLAALWVVLYHMRPPLAPEALFLLPQVVTRMGFMGVDIFFVISGAIMAETTRSRRCGPASALQFLLPRLARVYAGWWPFFAVYWFAYAVTGNLREDKRLLASFFLWPQSLQHYLLPITWTLSFEIMFYAVVAVLVLWNRNRAWIAFTAIGAAIIAANAAFWSAGLYSPTQSNAVSIFHTVYASPLFLELIAGFLVSEFLNLRPHARPLVWYLALLSFGIAAFSYQSLAPLAGEGMAGYFHAPERALLAGGFATALVGSAMVLERQQFSPFPWLQRLGDASYSLYLCHPLIIASMFLAAQKFGLSVFHQALAVLVVAGAAVVYCVAHYRFIERPLYLRFRKIIDKASHRNPLTPP
jgi:exopolysaccharide production protein ExoZ